MRLDETRFSRDLPDDLLYQRLVKNGQELTSDAAEWIQALHEEYQIMLDHARELNRALAEEHVWDHLSSAAQDASQSLAALTSKSRR